MVTHYGLVAGGDVDVYLADEGVVGLMGKHIVEGINFPIFFYGQDYLGALEAYAAAAAFSVFGVSFLSLRLVTLAFSLALAGLVFRFAYRAYSVSAARWATAAVAVAPMYFLQWNLKARGGFVEHLVLVLAVFLLFWRFYVRHERDGLLPFMFGFVSGLALWVNQLAAAYLGVMAALLFLDRRDRRGFRAAALGLCLGSVLLIGYNVVHPLATVKALARKSVVMNRVAVEEREESWVAKGIVKRVGALKDGADKLGLVFGVPVGEGVERLGLSAEARGGGDLGGFLRFFAWVPFLVFGASLIAARPRRGARGWPRPGPSELLVIFFAVTFVVGYVSPRYMLPAYPLAAVLLGVLLERQRGAYRNLAIAGFGAVLVFNLATWVDATTIPDVGVEGNGIQLLDFLEEEQLGRCYSAGPLYHLVFRSQERVILAPLQKDRYPAYNRLVESSDELCYVFREDQKGKRQHRAFTEFLIDADIRYQQHVVANYFVFYDFEPRSAITADVMTAVRNLEPVPVPVGAPKS
jgi:hypothetical protein